MLVRNVTRNTIISTRTEAARSFSARLLGLIPRSSLEPEEGLWLEPCSSIHMCFMQFPIDAVFVDSNGKVLHIIADFKPWRFSPWFTGAHGVLELPAGRCAGRLKPGEVLEFSQ